MQTIAPTIRVRRGEHFAIRIVNDIGGPSQGEHVSSGDAGVHADGDAQCADASHYVGYLNHTIDDRYHARSTPVDTNLHLHGYQGTRVRRERFPLDA